MANNLHLNNDRCSKKGLFTSGLRTDALIHLDSDLNANEYCSLPQGTHNARPFKRGVIFNDTQSDCVRSVSREGEETNLKLPTYEEGE